MKILKTLVIGLVLAGPAWGLAPLAGGSEAHSAVPGRAEWSGKASDNICGLSDFRMLSNPAVVRFDALMQDTPEMKELTREGIDPESPQGIQLRRLARSRVTRACEAVRRQRGHCSVWREIHNSQGKQAADITAHVLAKL